MSTDPFEAIDGVTFWFKPRVCTFRGGRTSNSLGTIRVEDERGLLVGLLSATIPPEIGTCGEDEFCVMRSRPLIHCEMGMHDAAINTFLFRIARPQVWTFATCASHIKARSARRLGDTSLLYRVDSANPRPRHRGHGGYVVSCPDCRDLIEVACVDMRDGWRAADTVKRLGGEL